ncbi:cytochrome P450 [Hypomontagnella submonticulosa]|nr:cytochrome P450 [Hypomontagnella submonticulosa]
MAYTNAAIKETPRLRPPAGTARKTELGAGLAVHTPTGDYPFGEVDVYNRVILIRRDPGVYGDTANNFVPERRSSDTAEQTPASAWRALERDPRNRIGQEVVNIEARVVVALIARSYEFVKVGTGESSLDGVGKPVIDSKGYYKVASDMCHP